MVAAHLRHESWQKKKQQQLSEERVARWIPHLHLGIYFSGILLPQMNQAIHSRRAPASVSRLHDPGKWLWANPGKWLCTTGLCANGGKEEERMGMNSSPKGINHGCQAAGLAVGESRRGHGERKWGIFQNFSSVIYVFRTFL